MPLSIGVGIILTVLIYYDSRKLTAYIYSNFGKRHFGCDFILA